MGHTGGVAGTEAGMTTSVRGQQEAEQVENIAIMSCKV